MMKNTDITAFIIAGGKSNRMGIDKGLILFRNQPMILHTIHKLKDLFENIIINSNNPQYLSFNHPVIPDIVKDAGPLGGLYSCLSVSKTKYNIIFPCDMPLIESNLIKILIKNKDKAPIVMPQHGDGKLEPLVAIYQTSVLKQVEKQIIKKQFRIDLLLKECNHYLIQLSDYFNSDYKKQLTNINTIKDLTYEKVS